MVFLVAITSVQRVQQALHPCGWIYLHILSQGQGGCLVIPLWPYLAQWKAKLFCCIESLSGSCSVFHVISCEPHPLKMKAHFTRSHAASSVYFRNVPVSKNCKATTWSNPLTLSNITPLTWQLGLRPSSTEQYSNFYLIYAANSPHFHCPEGILLANHLQWDPQWHILKEERMLLIYLGLYKARIRHITCPNEFTN